MNNNTAHCVFLAFAMLMFTVIVCHLECGCALFRGDAGPAAAEAAYTGQLLRCVDEAKTLAESKACRARVDAEWKVDGGAK